MIGNDIVDIAAARSQSNWQRPGFLQKLFTMHEQKLIKEYYDPEIIVWVLWSMKEAAYKIYNRETGIRAYIPHLLKCSLNLQDLTGTVSIKDKSYYTTTIIKEDLVNTIAVANNNSLDKIVFTNTKHVLKDSHGLPYIAAHNNKFDASVSHHGRYSQAVYIG